jgi:hypothetical protein
MEEKNTMPYIEEYTSFIKNYSLGEVSSEEVGNLVVRMAQYFAEHNLRLVLAERALALVAKENVEGVDESTGKQVSVAKADILTSASDEAYERSQAKAHLVNCEQFINALKSLQRGLQNEYSHMST